MIDVMVLSVLSLNVGNKGSSSFVLPVHHWSSVIKEGLEKEKMYVSEITVLQERLKNAQDKLAYANQMMNRQDSMQSSTMTEVERLREAQQRLAQEKEAAQKQAGDALVKANIALQKQQMAEELAQKAQLAASDAHKRAEEAEIKALTAEKQLSSIEKQMAEVSEQEKTAQKTAAKAQAEADLAKQEQLNARLSAERAAQKAILAHTEAIKSKQQAEFELRKRQEIEQRMAQTRAEHEASLASQREAERRLSQTKAELENLRENSGATTTEMVELKSKQDQTYKQLLAANMANEEAIRRLTDMEQQLSSVYEQKTSAEERALHAMEKAKLAEMEAQHAREAELAARQNADSVENRAVAAQEYIGLLRTRVADLKAQQQITEYQLSSEKEKATELKTTIEIIEKEKKQSIWSLRSDSLCQVQYQLEYVDDYSGSKRKSDALLYLPSLSYGDATYLPGTLDMLHLSPRAVRSARGSIALTAVCETDDGGDAWPAVALLSLSQSKQASLFKLAPKEQSGIVPLQLAGIQYVLENRLQEALLFKSNDPNKGLRVQVVPTIDNRFLSVRPPQKQSFFSRSEIGVGDYLCTESGLFIGIMVTRELCYVYEKELAPDSIYSVPIGDLTSAAEMEVMITFSEQP